MHFLSDTAPMTLHSDASDYGVGGYLLQTVNGIGQPVALDCKLLNKFQLRWSVMQNEANGIFYSFHFCAEDCSRLERTIEIYYSSKKRLTQ